MPYIFYIVILHILLSTTYALFFYFKFNKGFLSRFLTCNLVPIFGFVIFLLLDLTNENLKSIKENLKKDISTPFKAKLSSQSKYTDNTSKVVPLHDALQLKSTKHKREILFSNLNGNFRKTYPILKAMLKDKDSEVVFHSAATITEIHQKISEEYEFTKSIFHQKPNTPEIGLDFFNSLVNGIHWDELNHNFTLEKRKELLYVFNYLSKFSNKLSEEYYIEKVNNDIFLKNYSSGVKTCKLILKEFPKSENIYICVLNFFYSFKKESNFNKLLNYIQENDFYFSSKYASMVLYWQKNLN